MHCTPRRATAPPLLLNATLPLWKAQLPPLTCASSLSPFCRPSPCCHFFSAQPRLFSFFGSPERSARAWLPLGHARARQTPFLHAPTPRGLPLLQLYTPCNDSNMRARGGWQRAGEGDGWKSQGGEAGSARRRRIQTGRRCVAHSSLPPLPSLRSWRSLTRPDACPRGPAGPGRAGRRGRRRASARCPASRRAGASGGSRAGPRQAVALPAREQPMPPLKRPRSPPRRSRRSVQAAPSLPPIPRAHSWAATSMKKTWARLCSALSG